MIYFADQISSFTKSILFPNDEPNWFTNTEHEWFHEKNVQILQPVWINSHLSLQFKIEDSPKIIERIKRSRQDKSHFCSYHYIIYTIKCLPRKLIRIGKQDEWPKSTLENSSKKQKIILHWLWLDARYVFFWKSSAVL